MARLFGGDLRTGVIQVRNIPASKGQASPTLNAAGGISCTVKLPLRDPVTDVPLALASILRPLKSFLAYEEGGVVLEAGPIWRSRYNFATRELELTAAGVRSYYDHRFVIPAPDDGDPDDVPTGTVTYSSLSLRTIQKRVVQQAHLLTGGALPIDFESDIAGSNERNYLASELHVVGEKLAQLTGVLGGPDVAFRPYITEDGQSLRWNMVTGDPLLQQAGPPHVFDTTGPRPNARGAERREDATTLLTDSIQQGTNGESDDPLQAKAYDDTLVDAGYPRMQGGENRPSVSTADVLQSHADAAVARGQYPLLTWAVSARRNAAPALGVYQPGDMAELVLPPNPVAGNGNDPHRELVRLMSFTANLGNDFVPLTFLPQRS